MGGGALNEQCSHYFDALRVWLGEITSVYAHVAVHEPLRIDPETGEQLTADADDFVSATLHFESGAAANVAMVWSSRIPAFGDLRVTGPQGTIGHRSAVGLFEAGPVTFNSPLDTPPDPLIRPSSEIDAGSDLPTPAEIEHLDPPEIIAASRRLLREFERGIREGTSPAPNFVDARRSQVLLDACRESSRTGRVVELPST